MTEKPNQPKHDTIELLLGRRAEVDERRTVQFRGRRVGSQQSNRGQTSDGADRGTTATLYECPIPQPERVEGCELAATGEPCHHHEGEPGPRTGYRGEGVPLGPAGVCQPGTWGCGGHDKPVVPCPGGQLVPVAPLLGYRVRVENWSRWEGESQYSYLACSHGAECESQDDDYECGATLLSPQLVSNRWPGLARSAGIEVPVDLDATS